VPTLERESQTQLPDAPVSVEGNGLSGGMVWTDLNKKKGSSCQGHNFSAGSSEARQVSLDPKASWFCHTPAWSILQVKLNSDLRMDSEHKGGLTLKEVWL